MTEYGVAYSPLSRNIYAGRISSDGAAFLSGKCEVTNQAVHAVAQHILDTYGEGPEDGMCLRTPDGSQFVVTVEVPSGDGEQS